MTPAFWKGRPVFLTGHTGFKGTWALAMLHELGANVTGFALAPPPGPAMFDLVGAAELCTNRRGDIRDLNILSAELAAARPEIVIHMAAQSLVRESYARPVETYSTNLMGTVHLLEACRSVPSVRAIVVVTTDKCYENFGWTWGYRENDRLGGADPYSNSKAACELAVDAYRRSFFTYDGSEGVSIQVASARAGNVIGGGDFAADRLVPDAVRAFLAGHALPIRNPRAIRPWQHVLDPLAGYLQLAERLHEGAGFSEGWNFGPRSEECAPVETVANLLVAQWGNGANWQQDDRYHPHEAATLKLDSTKARLELGWAPQFDIETAVDATIDWYLAYRNGDNVMERTLAQVGAYMDRQHARRAG